MGSIDYSIGFTQEEVASIMGTSTSVVGRLETGGGGRRHSPTLITLQNYAKGLFDELSLAYSGITFLMPRVPLSPKTTQNFL